MEEEIETVMVLSKKVKLRTINGQIIVGNLQVYESEDPYVLVFLVDTEFDSTLRMDVRKDDLALELRKWLEGKQIRNPVVLVPLRIEESITRFVKFGKTPLQEDLLMWMLSRSELYIDGKTADSDLIFGGRPINTKDLDDAHNTDCFKEENEFLRTSMAAMTVTGATDDQYRINDATGASHRTGTGNNPLRHSTMTMPQGTIKLDGGVTMKNGEDQGMFAMTKQLLGKSVTLSTIKKGKVKGREGAKTAVVSGAKWNSEALRMCADIEKARKDIEVAMDTRRRMIEVSKTRQLQSSEKYRKIRTTLDEQMGGNKFMTQATHELLTLQKIQADIEEDILKQKNIAQRAAQKVSWTIAPSAYKNRRGKSMKGPLLGRGPLAPNATSRLKDPRVEATMRRFYWDSAGRRHLNEQDSHNGDSLVDQAMEAIRKAAANVSAFKLDLKAVFREFDTSGDGLLSPGEMAQAFLSMGVKLDIESMNAIFKHFDPNDSGTVHFGEFVWGFFNRRGLVRQWKRKTEGLTPEQVKEKFHKADINGDGRLNPKEFKRLLKSFSIEIPDNDLEILINRFDVDLDGDIDLHEFKAFIESEQKNLFHDPNPGKTANTLPVPKAAGYLRGSQQGPLFEPGPAVGGRPSTAAGRPTTAAAGASATARAPATQQQQHQQHRPSHQTYPRPSSAPPRRVSPEAAVAAPHSVASRHSADHGASSSHAHTTSTKGATTATITAAQRKKAHEAGRDNLLEQNVDVLWMSRMLQAQADVEARLGHRYFN